MKTTGLDNTIIEGLPEGTLLFSKEISKLAERGGYRLIAFPIRPGVLELQIHPGEGGSAYQCRDRWNSVRYRDPERTTLQTWDADTDIFMTLAMPLSDIDTQLDTFGLPSDTVFRGMRNEEFTFIRETGQSWSKGELNIPASLVHGLENGDWGRDYLEELGGKLSEFSEAAILDKTPRF